MKLKKSKQTFKFISFSYETILIFFYSLYSYYLVHWLKLLFSVSSIIDLYTDFYIVALIASTCCHSFGYCCLWCCCFESEFINMLFDTCLHLSIKEIWNRGILLQQANYVFLAQSLVTHWEQCYRASISKGVFQMGNYEFNELILQVKVPFLW